MSPIAPEQAVALIQRRSRNRNEIGKKSS